MGSPTLPPPRARRTIERTAGCRSRPAGLIGHGLRPLMEAKTSIGARCTIPGVVACPAHHRRGCLPKLTPACPGSKVAASNVQGVSPIPAESSLNVGVPRTRDAARGIVQSDLPCRRSGRGVRGDPCRSPGSAAQEAVLGNPVLIASAGSSSISSHENAQAPPPPHSNSTPRSRRPAAISPRTSGSAPATPALRSSSRGGHSRT